MADWKAFLEKYTAFGRTPSVESYIDLFDPHRLAERISQHLSPMC